MSSDRSRFTAPEDNWCLYAEWRMLSQADTPIHSVSDRIFLAAILLPRETGATKINGNNFPSQQSNRKKGHNHTHNPVPPFHKPLPGRGKHIDSAFERNARAWLNGLRAQCLVNSSLAIFIIIPFEFSRDQYMGFNDLNRPPSGLSFFPTLSFAHSLPPLGEWCREVVRSRQWNRDIMVKENRNKSARRRLSRITEV